MFEICQTRFEKETFQKIWFEKELGSRIGTNELYLYEATLIIGVRNDLMQRK